ncbi:DUF2973 domain-containing protein [Alkalinema sp. FACHB-956]|uniref:DUF2973 domain-containing protein n=1 Tax=Alkalinema sp. FACHB-956 TaxID=2692768 RepID=UPI0016825820|nr:DUF2973 domain-containing protein [Alkalinema sp. FACHB-956]MBD2327208.1 DUF2973 domain-containing protein [Alkalinema sp. FACHB-956]
MWLHILYIIAFTIVAFLAVGNLIRSMLTLGLESQRELTNIINGSGNNPAAAGTVRRQPMPTHPEMLDADGKVINEPLLVMRSMSVEDAREQLDAIYRSSPGGESSNPSDEDS